MNSLSGYAKFKLFLLFITLIVTSSHCLSDTVYVIKYSWHTGFIIELTTRNIELMPVLNEFKQYNYIDIGWGDDEFYRSTESFPADLALKAILYPTKSVVRIEGKNLPIKQLVETSDFFIQFVFSSEEFDRLAKFINSSFFLDDNGTYKIVETRLNGKIKFFESPLKYHGLNTCNTWIAKGLKAAGCNIRAFGVTTADILYSRITNCGKILKPLE